MPKTKYEYRKIRLKERKNGMKFCSFCKPERVDAIYRDYGGNSFACERHKENVKVEIDDGYRTEADYQSWMRL